VVARAEDGNYLRFRQEVARKTARLSRQKERLAIPLPSQSRPSLSPSLVSCFPVRKTRSCHLDERPFRATCFSEERGRIPGHRRELTPVTHPPGRSRRASQKHSRPRPRRIASTPAPRCSLLPWTRHLALGHVAACCSTVMGVADHHIVGGHCRMYIAAARHAPADFDGHSRALHTHSLRTASSVSPKTTSSPLPPM